MEDHFEESLVQEIQIESIEMIEIEELNTGSKQEVLVKRKPNIALEEQKKEVAKLVRKYACLWDKKDKFYRNMMKRNAAWETIGTTLNISGMFAKIVKQIVF